MPPPVFFFFFVMRGGWQFQHNTRPWPAVCLSQAKGMLEERNNSLLEQVSQLKEEARNADNRCITLEAECRRLQADLAEVSCKLSLSEGQLQMMIKVISHF